MTRDDLRIGLDLGGTKIEAVLARRTVTGLDALERRRGPTERERGYEAIVEAAAALVASLSPDPLPVGVGMPGGLTRAGLVKNSNTTCLNGRPFRQYLARRLAPRRV